MAPAIRGGPDSLAVRWSSACSRDRSSPVSSTRAPSTRSATSYTALPDCQSAKMPEAPCSSQAVTSTCAVTPERSAQSRTASANTSPRGRPRRTGRAGGVLGPRPVVAPAVRLAAEPSSRRAGGGVPERPTTGQPRSGDITRPGGDEHRMSVDQRVEAAGTQPRAAGCIRRVVARQVPSPTTHA